MPLQANGLRTSRKDINLHLNSLQTMYNDTRQQQEDVFSGLKLLSPPRSGPRSAGGHCILGSASRYAPTALEQASDGPWLAAARRRPTGVMFYKGASTTASTPQDERFEAIGPLGTPSSPSMMCSVASSDASVCRQDSPSPFGSCVQAAHVSPQTVSCEMEYAPPEQDPLIMLSHKLADRAPGVVRAPSEEPMMPQRLAFDAVDMPPPPPQPLTAQVLPRKDAVLALLEKQRRRAQTVVPPPTRRKPDGLQAPMKAPEAAQEDARRPEAAEDVEPWTLGAVRAETSHAPRPLHLSKPGNSNAALLRLKSAMQQRRTAQLATMTASRSAASSDAQTSSSVGMGPMGQRLGGSVSSETQPLPAARRPSGTEALKTPGPVLRPHAPPAAGEADPSLHASEGAPSTGRPYLKRRSQAVAMQQLPDWSTVKSRTQTTLDPNLQPRARGTAGRPGKAAGSAATQPRSAPRAASVPAAAHGPLGFNARQMRAHSVVHPTAEAVSRSTEPRRGAACAARKPWGSAARSPPPRRRIGQMYPAPEESFGGRGSLGPLGSAFMAHHGSDVGEGPLAPLLHHVDTLLGSMERAMRG